MKKINLILAIPFMGASIFITSCRTSSLNLKESSTQHVGSAAKPYEIPPPVTTGGVGATPTYVPGTPTEINRLVDKIASEIKPILSRNDATDLVIQAEIAIRPVASIDMNLYKGFIADGINKWLAAIQKGNSSKLNSLSILIKWVDQTYDSTVDFNSPNNSFWHSALCNPTEENRGSWNQFNLIVFITDLYDAPPNCTYFDPSARFPGHDTAQGHATIGGGYFVFNLARIKRSLMEANIVDVNPIPEQMVKHVIEHELGHVFGVGHLEELTDVKTGQSGLDFCIWNPGDSYFNYGKSIMCGHPTNISNIFVENIAKRDNTVPSYSLQLTAIEEQAVQNYMNSIISTP